MLQTARDENVITTDNLLPRPKNASEGLYEPIVIGLNVVVIVHPTLCCFVLHLPWLWRAWVSNMIGFCVGFGHPELGNILPSSSSKLPKMNFPSFDGENPKLWIS